MVGPGGPPQHYRSTGANGEGGPGGLYRGGQDRGGGPRTSLGHHPTTGPRLLRCLKYENVRRLRNGRDFLAANKREMSEL